MKQHRSVAILFLLLFSSFSHAQSWQDTLTILNKIIQRYAENEPGAQIAVSRNGQVLYSAARGLDSLNGWNSISHSGATAGYHVSLQRARNVRYIPAISGSADRFN